jgi:hypothetical protein
MQQRQAASPWIKLPQNRTLCVAQFLENAVVIIPIAKNACISWVLSLRARSSETSTLLITPRGNGRPGRFCPLDFWV